MMNIFTSIFGRKKDPTAADKVVKPVFVEKKKRGTSTFEIYTAPNAESARKFLLTKKVDQPLYFVVVDTPDGSWGVDALGLYLEHLRQWQTNRNLVECRGVAHSSNNQSAVELAARSVNDNYVTRVTCGNCQHEWWDAVRYLDFTVVRCPRCGRYNEVDTSNQIFLFTGGTPAVEHSHLGMVIIDNHDAVMSFSRLADVCKKLAGASEEVRGTEFGLLRGNGAYIISIRTVSHSSLVSAIELMGVSGIWGSQAPMIAAKQEPESFRGMIQDLSRLPTIQMIRIAELPAARSGPCPLCSGRGEIAYKNPHTGFQVSHKCQFCRGTARV